MNNTEFLEFVKYLSLENLSDYSTDYIIALIVPMDVDVKTKTLILGACIFIVSIIREFTTTFMFVIFLIHAEL